MITETNAPLLRALIYKFIVRDAVKRSFHRVWLRQDENVPKPGSMPILLYANHTSWWDGYMVCLLFQEAWQRNKRRWLVMAEEETLKKYPFFRSLGAFGVNRQSPRDGIAAIQHAVGCMCDQPYGVCVVFPQGKFHHVDARPLGFYNGVGLIAKQTLAQAGVCALVPMALRYEFCDEQLPHAFITLGAPKILRSNYSAEISAKAITQGMEQQLIAEMDTLRDQCLHRQFELFVPIVRGALGIQETWDWVRKKLRWG